VVTQAESFPIDLGGHPSQIIPDSLRPIHSRFETWVVTQAESSPFRDLGGHPGRFIPDLRLGWSPKPNHPRFETWVVTQADSSPIRDRLTWVVTQAESFPIRDLGGHPSQIIPVSRPGWSPRPILGWSPIRDLSGHSGRIIPDLRLGWSPKPNHP
jgi:hypothetical protein